MEQSDTSVDLEGLDYQIESMIELSENTIKTGSIARKARTCKVCGKEGILTDIKRHIEALHITGASHPCGICGNTFRSRCGLALHIAIHTNEVTFFSISGIEMHSVGMQENTTPTRYKSTRF